MTLLRYWILVELAFIILVLSFLMMQIWRRAGKHEKDGKRQLPAHLSGKVLFLLKYILKLLGVGVGALLLISLVIALERTIITFFKETQPAPSSVEIPANPGFDVEEVTFESTDGLNMAGWFVPSRNDVTVILLHGYGGNRTAMIWHAEQLVEAGYGVLMYDARASGESEGTHRSYGWEDTRDLGGAIGYLESRNKDGIGIAGCSMGAMIALSGATMYPQLEAVWADGASSVRAQDMPAPKDPIAGLIHLSNYLLDWIYITRLDLEPPEPLTDRLDELASRPVMFVGGGTPKPLIGSEADHFTRRYAELTGPNAQAWVIDEATHCDEPRQRPEEYSARMVEFFDTAFDIER